jgi:hypothetical protein
MALPHSGSYRHHERRRHCKLVEDIVLMVAFMRGNRILGRQQYLAIHPQTIKDVQGIQY